MIFESFKESLKKAWQEAMEEQTKGEKEKISREISRKEKVTQQKGAGKEAEVKKEIERLKKEIAEMPEREKEKSPAEKITEIIKSPDVGFEIWGSTIVRNEIAEEGKKEGFKPFYFGPDIIGYAPIIRSKNIKRRFSEICLKELYKKPDIYIAGGPLYKKRIEKRGLLFKREVEIKEPVKLGECLDSPSKGEKDARIVEIKLAESKDTAHRLTIIRAFLMLDEADYNEIMGILEKDPKTIYRALEKMFPTIFNNEYTTTADKTAKKAKIFYGTMEFLGKYNVDKMKEIDLEKNS